MKPSEILYQSFIQSVRKTPKKISKMLAKVDKFSATLPKEKQQACADLCTSCYDVGENYGFQSGFFTALELVEEFLKRGN